MAISVKSATGGSNTSGLTLALPAFGVNPAAGDLILVEFSWFCASSVASAAPTDSAGGNTYTQVGSDLSEGSFVKLAVWKAENLVNGGSSFVVTVHIASGTIQGISAVARVITGQLTPTAYNSDLITANTTGTSSATSGNTSPTPPAGSLFIGGITDNQTNPASYTPEASWNDQGKNQTNNSTSQDLGTEDFVNSSASVLAATWTGPNGSFGAYLAHCLSFAPAGGVVTAKPRGPFVTSRQDLP